MIQITAGFLDMLLLTTLLLVQQIKLYRGLYLKRSNSLLNLNQDKIMDKDFQVVMDTTQWDIISLIIVMIYKHS
jgi:phosphoglycerol transferase MdoB-like AlkP superfamily enzyme